jgi:dTDP-4-amino-4,6-dideoxygalactose transaminase
LSLFREIPPTAGWPLALRNLLPAFLDTKNKNRLEEDFKSCLPSPYAKVVYSGTAALFFILESIKKLSPKKTVVIPAFVCPLVALAIKRANLKIQVCDTNPDDFGFDLNQLKDISAENTDILAVLAVHLAGLPVDCEALIQITKQNQAFLIEDCAQSLGAEYKNEKTGTFGDFAFFSLCRGKGLTIYEGGLIISKNPEYAAILEETTNKLAKRDILSESLKIVELFAYWMFYRPQLFWFAFRLPQLYWLTLDDKTRALGDYFTEDFTIHSVSDLRKAVGHMNFPHLETMLSGQRQKAKLYLEALRDIPGIKSIGELPGTKASWPYLTVLFNNQRNRDAALRILQSMGLGASQVYLSAITDYAYLRKAVNQAPCPNAQSLAARAMTLSTSVFLNTSEIDRIAQTIRKVAANR